MHENLLQRACLECYHPPERGSQRNLTQADRYQQAPNIEVEQMSGETVLLNVSTSRFCLLNHSAAVVWTALREPATIQSIVTSLGSAFAGVSESQASTDAMRILDELKTQGFVVGLSQ